MPPEEKYNEDFRFDWTIAGAKVIPINKKKKKKGHNFCGMVSIA